MTDAEKLRALLPTLHPEAGLSREMITDIIEAMDSGEDAQEEIFGALISAVVTLERGLIDLQARVDGEGTISGGGIQVFDPDDRPWEDR